MSIANKLNIAALALSAAVLASAAPALAQSSVSRDARLDVSAGIGLFVVQKQTLRCTFTPNGGELVDAYPARSTNSVLPSAKSRQDILSGASSPRRRVCPGARWQDLMPASALRPRLALGSAPMRSPAARGVRSP